MSEATPTPTPASAAERQPLKILLVEDNPGDALLIRVMLAKVGGSQTTLDRADRLSDALKRLDLGGINAVLLDLSLPDSQGLETFNRIYERVPQIPILILTSHDDEGIAVRAVHHGAQDYLLKGQVDGPVLLRALHHALERKRILEALRENEQRYKLLIETTSDYIYTVAIQGGVAGVTTHGPGCVAVTGYRPDDYARDSTLWYRMIHADDRAAVLEDAARAVAGLPTVPVEHRILHKDGRLRWVKHTSVPRRNERGEVVAVDGIISDITERRLAEERLRNSEALYQSLVESLPQNIFRKDLHGVFTFANASFCKELGRTADQILGRTDFDFFPHELAARYRADDERVITTQKLFEFVEQHVTPDGHQLSVQVVKIPLLDSNRATIGIQGIFWDITQQKRNEEELRRSADALRAANAELKSAQLQLIQAEKMLSVAGLAAGVAHEVKNPLAVLSLGVEFLNQQPFAKQGDLELVLKDMTDAIERANVVIGGLLDFSREKELELTAESVTAVAERALKLISHLLANRSIEIIRQFQNDLPAISIDRVKIEQVFVNLFTNAIHAMPRFGTLSVRAYQKTLAEDEAELNPGLRGWDRIRAGDRVVVFEIDDTGPGIPDDKLSRVFDPFYTTKPTNEGTGLGLSVVSKILELHNAMISIRNRPEGGVRVKLFFRAPQS